MRGPVRDLSSTQLPTGAEVVPRVENKPCLLRAVMMRWASKLASTLPAVLTATEDGRRSNSHAVGTPVDNTNTLDPRPAADPEYLA
jgi:hypothetical protein